MERGNVRKDVDDGELCGGFISVGARSMHHIRNDDLPWR